MGRMRVVLDTNVLASGLAYPASVLGRILSAWRQGGLAVVLSHYILNELARIIPKMNKAPMTAVEIQHLLDILIFQAEIVAPDGLLDDELRDPDDQPVLQTLLASKAQYLITGDKDLIALAHRYAIVTPAQFWVQHGD